MYVYISIVQRELQDGYGYMTVKRLSTCARHAPQSVFCLDLRHPLPHLREVVEAPCECERQGRDLLNNPDRVAGLYRHIGLLFCIRILCPTGLIRPSTRLDWLIRKFIVVFFFILLRFGSMYIHIRSSQPKPESKAPLSPTPQHPPPPPHPAPAFFRPPPPHSRAHIYIHTIYSRIYRTYSLAFLLY